MVDILNLDPEVRAEHGDGSDVCPVSSPVLILYRCLFCAMRRNYSRNSVCTFAKFLVRAP